MYIAFNKGNKLYQEEQMVWSKFGVLNLK